MDCILAQSEPMLVFSRVPRGPEYAVGWFTLAMINAGLAQSKNRSGLAWFLVSLLAGPFATFVLVAFCDRKPMLP